MKVKKNSIISGLFLKIEFDGKLNFNNPQFTEGISPPLFKQSPLLGLPLLFEKPLIPPPPSQYVQSLYGQGKPGGKGFFSFRSGKVRETCNGQRKNSIFIRIPALLENQGKLKNHIKFRSSEGNSGKVRQVVVLKAMNQGKLGKKFSK